MKNIAANTDEFLAALPAWQQDNLSVFRSVIHEVLPTVEEQIKWGVPVFMDGARILFAMSGFKDHTKFNFIQNGALLDDPDHLFNNGFESKKSRGIDLRKGEALNLAQLATLVHAAIDATH